MHDSFCKKSNFHSLELGFSISWKNGLSKIDCHGNVKVNEHLLTKSNFSHKVLKKSSSSIAFEQILKKIFRFIVVEGRIPTPLPRITRCAKVVFFLLKIFINQYYQQGIFTPGGCRHCFQINFVFFLVSRLRL